MMSVGGVESGRVSLSCSDSSSRSTTNSEFSSRSSSRDSSPSKLNEDALNLLSSNSFSDGDLSCQVSDPLCAAREPKTFTETPLDARMSALNALSKVDLSNVYHSNLKSDALAELVSEVYARIASQNQNAIFDNVSTKNMRKNRYSNVLPHSDNRITVCNGDYINASPVVLFNRDYILTQAPLEHTLDDFKIMIVQQQVDTLLTLAMSFEEGKVKGIDYWTSITESEKVLFTKGSESIVERTLLINGRRVRQLHYQNWPDHGVPKIALILKLIKEVVSVKSPLLVHCSAGLGRAGLFVVGDALIRENPPLTQVPLTQRILEARQCRPGLLTNETQVRAIVDMLLLSNRDDF